MYHKNIIIGTQQHALLQHHISNNINNNNNINNSNTIDANNNNHDAITITIGSCHPKPEKYSLRQRHKRSAAAADCDDENDDHDDVDDIGTAAAIRGNQHTVKRSSAASGPKKAKKSPTTTAAAKATATKKPPAAPKPKKPKPKAAPLSKYRRKTANARERTRMREINCAFENLRKFVPTSFDEADEVAAAAAAAAASSVVVKEQSNEKLTKITTLRLAMKYIQSLNDVLRCGPTTVTTTGQTMQPRSTTDAQSSSPSSASSSSSPSSSSSSSTSSSSSDSDASSDSTSPSPANGRIEMQTPTDPTSYGLTMNAESEDLLNDLLMTAYGSTDVLRHSKPARINNPNAMSCGRQQQQQHQQQLQQQRRFAGSYHPHAKTAAIVGVDGCDINGNLHNNTSIMFSQPTCQQQQLAATSMLNDIGLLFVDATTGDDDDDDDNSVPMSDPTMMTTAAAAAAAAADTFGGGGSGQGIGFSLADSDCDSLELSEPCLSPLAGLDGLGGSPFGDLMLMHSTDFGDQHQLEMYFT